MSALAVIQLINNLIGAGKSVEEIYAWFITTPLGKEIEAKQQANLAAFVAQAAKDYPGLASSNAQAMENLKTMGIQGS